MIERVVASELRNPVKLDFAPGGVRCELMIPVREPTEFAMRPTKAQARARLKSSHLED